jgi:hypothetical protein
MFLPASIISGVTAISASFHSHTSASGLATLARTFSSKPAMSKGQLGDAGGVDLLWVKNFM